MNNKPFIFLSVILFGIIVSYIALGWQEPQGNMPTDYKAPINTSIETQNVTEGKPVVANLDADKVDGYEASDLLAATTAASGASTLNLVVAQFAKNKPALDFPDCPSGFTPILQDGFVQYQNQQNVIGAYYDTYCNYRTRASLNGVDVPLIFKVYKNTQNATCYYTGTEYFNNTSSPIGIKCVGDCSNCSDAANVSVTYSVCTRDPLSGTFQGGEISAPVITSLNSERLISDIPYKGRLKITANVNNGGENVTAKLYIDNTLVDTQTVTTSYSCPIKEVPESHTSNIKLVVTNSAGSGEKTISTWVGAIGGGMHTEADCTNAGGEVVVIQPGQRTCRFDRSSVSVSSSSCEASTNLAAWSCPSGWTGYYNWSTTGPYSNTYYGAGSACCCSVGGGHTWSNKAQEYCSDCWDECYCQVRGRAQVLQRGCY
ncbi:MAG: hypothetical protein ACOX0B_04060 [Minisyncoccales bacterium]|jgi:hypothetical protein